MIVAIEYFRVSFSTEFRRDGRDEWSGRDGNRPCSVKLRRVKAGLNRDSVGVAIPTQIDVHAGVPLHENLTLGGLTDPRDGSVVESSWLTGAGWREGKGEEIR
jgi:hypothetical protein